jgi:hypothetical protein
MRSPFCCLLPTDTSLAHESNTYESITNGGNFTMKWFAHDTDMHRNRKIRKLFRVHGGVAYGFWCVLLEKLYAAEGDFQIPVDHLWLEDIADDMKMSDYRTPCRILDTMAEIGLIDRQLWEEHIIYSPAIAKRGDGYMVKRAQEAEKKRRYREKQRELLTTATEALSTVDTTGTVGQKFIMSPADPDPDPDPEIDKNLLESYIPECPDIEPLCSADALRDRAPISKIKQPEPSEPAKQEADTVTPLDSQAEEPGAQPKPRTRKKSTAGGKTKTEAQHHPEAFAKFWNDYRGHLKAIESNVWVTQKRPEAIKVWDSLIASGVPLETILEGAQAWFELTLRMMKAKGKVYGAPHCCRFLSGRLWESALDDKRSQPAPAFQPPARPQAKRDGQVEITGLLMELRRTVLLPDDWQARTGKQLSTQLGPEDSADYAAFLRQERDRLMSGAVF